MRACKSSFLNDLSDNVLRTFLETTVAANDGRNLTAGEILSMGGAIGRVGEEETAYSHRDALVDFLAVRAGPTAPRRTTGWTPPAASGGSGDRSAAGVYVNNLGSEGQDRVREAYGVAKYARLTEIKARYDPDNVFRHNSNIRPGP